MESPGHMERDTLIGIAAGDPDLGAAAAAHVAGCGLCSQQVADLLGALDAAAEELRELRPDCLSAEDLASIPPGGEWDHPHVRDCPVCREEIGLLFGFETQERLGIAIDDGIFVRPELLESAASMGYAAEGPFELQIRPGAEIVRTVAGSTVRLRVEGQELLANLQQPPESEIILVLSDDLLERSLQLVHSKSRIPLGRWKRASVAPRNA